MIKWARGWRRLERPGEGAGEAWRGLERELVGDQVCDP